MGRFDHAIEDEAAIERRDLARRDADGPGEALRLSFLPRRGRWRSGAVFLVQAVVVAGGLWKGWNAFHESDVLDALHWGLPTFVLIVALMVIKLALWQAAHLNRLHLAAMRVERRA